MGTSRRATTPRLEPLDGHLPLGAGWTPSLLILGLLVVGAALAIGGVHPETRLIALGLATAGLVLRLARLRSPPHFGLWGLALGVAAGAALVQWLPLPAALVEALSPSRHAVAVAIAEALGEPAPAWLRLGLDGGTVLFGLAGICLHLFVFLTARHQRQGQPTQERLVLLIEGAALLVIGAGVFHQLLGWEALLGFYAPSAGGGGPFPTTFVNPNHMAALCLLAALLAFGAAIAVKERAMVHSVIGVIAAVGVMASMSRANAALLIVGLVAVAAPWWFQGRDEGVGAERRVRAGRFLIAFFALLFIGFIFIGPDRWLKELEVTLEADFAAGGLVTSVWDVGWRVTREHLVAGVGAGNMGLATPALMESWVTGHVSHSHNALLETLGELGLFAGGVAILLTGAGFVAYGRRAFREPIRWAGLVALAAMLVQNMVDFSLWIPGVGIAAMVTAGMVAGQVALPPGLPRLRWVAAGAVTLIALVAGLVTAFGDGYRWRSTAREAIAAGAPLDWRALARDHGAHFMAVELAGRRAELDGDAERAGRLATLALSRAPRAPSTVARAFRVAVTRAESDADAIAAELLEALMAQHHPQRVMAYELLLGARTRPAVLEAFLGRDPERLLEVARRLRQQGEAEAGLELLRWGIERFPDAPLVLETYGHHLGRGAAAREALSRIGTRALLRASEAEDPAEGALWEKVAWYFEGIQAADAQRHAQAFRLFMAAAERHAGEEGEGFDRDRRVRALFRAAESALRLDGTASLEAAVTALDAERIDQPGARAQRHLFRSHLHERGRDLRAAIREMQSVLHHQPDLARHHHRLAELFERAGDREAATRATLRARALSAPSEGR